MSQVKTLQVRGTRSSSRSRKDDNAPALLYYMFLGGPVEPVYEKITKPEQLIEYIIQTGESETVKNQLKIPYVILFENTIIDVKNESLDSYLTSPENPIKICWKYIKNANLSLNYFFDHRGLKPDVEFLWKKSFRFAIEKLQDKTFSPSETDVAFIQKSAVVRRNRKNEGSVTNLIGDILTACITKNDLETTSVEEQYSFSDKDKHEAIVDHVIFKATTLRPILICEDKFNMITEGILQNFDQLRTFAATEHGKKFNIIYGITSNFNEWVFCCYLCPVEGKDVTADHFCVSDTYKMKYDDVRGLEPLSDSIKEITQKIRGFFFADIDKIVIESFKTGESMNIEETGI